ncbi:hypothetical protein P153DRAFT_403682 [Dothidotthia symphoricarpi CBS 119687]|uniref:Uncharacterized protein n=1 Tax=Dothidotthia symphoricarpi CBS 119687 TaxID=1392245 RepID=A0A6A6AD02_9PLEO|nr:uncharacterized protein P153DRAFT_403682 [Dothidotthia symphoricarpi CBS 119687]KAF2128798.1 hypothetical protein P153DRAFT_403682 [Dothidotthia symphoricarpi CBS 119687]
MDLAQELVAHDLFVALAAAGAFVGLPALVNPSSTFKYTTKTVSQHVHTPVVITVTATTTHAPVTSTSVSTTTTTESLTDTITSFITETLEWHPTLSVTSDSFVSPTPVFVESEDVIDAPTVLLTSFSGLDRIHLSFLASIVSLIGLLCTLLHRHGIHANPLTSVNEDSPKWRGHIEGRQDADKRAATAELEKKEVAQALQRERLEKTELQRQLGYACTAIQRLVGCDPDAITGVKDNKTLATLLDTKEKTRKDQEQCDSLREQEKREHLEKLISEHTEKITKLESDLALARDGSAYYIAAMAKDKEIDELDKKSKERELRIEHLELQSRSRDENHLQDVVTSLRDQLASLKAAIAEHECPIDTSAALSEANAQLTTQLGEAREQKKELEWRLREQQSTTLNDSNSTSDEHERLRNELKQAKQTVYGLRRTIAEKDQVAAEKEEHYKDLMAKAEKTFEDMNSAHAKMVDGKNKEILGLEANNTTMAQGIVELKATVAFQTQEVSKLELEKTQTIQAFQQNADRAFNDHKRNWETERVALMQDLSKSKQEQRARDGDLDSDLQKAAEEARQWREYGDQQRLAKNEALDAKDGEINKLKSTVRTSDTRIKAAIVYMDRVLSQTDESTLFDEYGSIVEQLTGQYSEPDDAPQQVPDAAAAAAAAADKKELEKLRAKLADLEPAMKEMSKNADIDLEDIKRLNEEIANLAALRNFSSDIKGFLTSVEMLLEQVEEMLQNKSAGEVKYNVNLLVENIGTALKKIKGFQAAEV